MTLTHCACMATRKAFQTGDVHHVIATGCEDMPLAVIDQHRLFQLADRLDHTALLFSADPFADAAAG